MTFEAEVLGLLRARPRAVSEITEELFGDESSWREVRSCVMALSRLWADGRVVLTCENPATFALAK